MFSTTSIFCFVSFFLIVLCVQSCNAKPADLFQLQADYQFDTDATKRIAPHLRYGKEVAPHVRYGKEVAPHVRYGKEVAQHLRYGKEVAPHVRYGKEVAPHVRYGKEVAPHLRYGKEVAPHVRYGKSGEEESFGGVDGIEDSDNLMKSLEEEIAEDEVELSNNELESLMKNAYLGDLMETIKMIKNRMKGSSQSLKVSLVDFQKLLNAANVCCMREVKSPGKGVAIGK